MRVLTVVKFSVIASLKIFRFIHNNEYQELNNFLGSKARPARKADNLTAISEPVVKVMWDP
jgi:hypothetical protein